MKLIELRILPGIMISIFALVYSEVSYPQVSQFNSRALEQIIQAAERNHGLEFSGTDENTINKCGLWVSFEINRSWTAFNESQKERIRKILSPPVLQKDTLIGKFHIFYDTTGQNVPALLDLNHNRIPNSYAAYIDSVGYYFNYVWNYFLDPLGYSSPPYQAGNNYYNIYIEELWDYYNPLYGETVFTQNDQIGGFYPARFTSYIRIDNDFKDLKSEGIAGLKVTCAHELHHAFQLGSYGYLSNDVYFYEITSTWMEDVIFNDVNDYYQYIKSPLNQPRGQFYYPDISFTSPFAGVTYSRAIWGKFIEKRFSRDLMRESWEFIRSGQQTLNAIDHVLNLAGSDFRKAFLEWTIWNNNTGPSCDTVKYYSEGKTYPQMRLRPAVEYSKSLRSFTDSIDVLSSAYYPICLLNSPSDNCDLSPQMMTIISNVNMIPANSVKRGFSYEISPRNSAGATQLSNGVYIRLDADDPGNWVSQENVPVIVSDILLYPNPFYPKGNKPLTFHLPPVLQSAANLYIYASSMDKIVSREMNVMSQSFEPFIEWDGHDSNRRIVPTGVYFYVIDIDGKQYTGKFSVIRE